MVLLTQFFADKSYLGVDATTTTTTTSLEVENLLKKASGHKLMQRKSLIFGNSL